MAYRLHVSRPVQAVWDTLPDPASEALTYALAQVCDDPHAITTPYGEDDGIMRTLALPMLVAVLLIDPPSGQVSIVQITHLG